MRRFLWVAAIALLLNQTMTAANNPRPVKAENTPSKAPASPWGKNYFPNVPLVTDRGETVHFFDDLIRGKIVAINFIYTHCSETCPLETAQLARVQSILGDKLGKDIFFYSISIDPAKDTPQVLREYKKKFRANWTFLTGKAEDITLIRKKLGLYIPEIQDGSNNHNVNLIIGNQTTGRWMKRSPFENPHVLADQLINWLADWKQAPPTRNYANAPQLRNVSPGELLFRTRCASCHGLTGKEPANALAPDLLGVTRLRDRQWLINWLKAPDRMLEQKDPIALALFEQYNRLKMPNFRLNPQQIQELLTYIAEQTQGKRMEQKSLSSSLD